jgi:hypothetical protein
MLWLLVLVIVGVMLIVMTHKPAINPAGAQWVPPDQRLDAAPRSTAAPTVPPVEASAPPPVETMNFNDLYSGAHKMPKPPGDQPQA